MEPNSASQLRLADYIRPLTARWWMILIAVVVATGGIYAYYVRKPNVYTTSTLVYVQDPGDPVTGLPSPGETDRQVADEATLTDSRGVAAAVAPKIGFNGGPDALLADVSITSKEGQDFVQVSASAGTPTLAAAIANAFAGHLVSSLNGGEVLRIASALKLSQTQLAQLAKGPAADAQRANLADQVNRLQLALRVPSAEASQVNKAQAPSSPSAPKPLRNALYALAISLVAAIALAYGVERFDRRLKNPDEMEDVYQRPLLAVLPHSNEPAPAVGGEPALGSEFREPFRVLRTNIELAALDRPPRTIVVSSAMPGEGKSTVVRNLALAYRESGRRVAVVDLDLRHPALGRLFGVEGGPGITEVLRHDADLDDVMLSISVGLRGIDQAMLTDASALSKPNGSNGANGRNGHSGLDVSLILTGVRPSNPPAVLASARLTTVLDELRDRYDVVLIDSAPILAVTDTVPLLRYADGALFVGRLDVTTRDTAKRLMEYLRRVPDMRLLGIVANDLSRLEAGGYGYGYGYGNYGDAPKSRLGRRKADPEHANQPV